MISNSQTTHHWQGKSLTATVLYSAAGIAQQIWVAHERGAVLIDAGDGVLRDLLTHQCKPDRLRGILLTHGHFDHMGGLHSLLGFLRMIGRKSMLPIYAPPGCTEVFSLVNNFEKCYLDTIPYEISCRECRAGEDLQLDGMTIRAYPVVHCGGIAGLSILDQVPAVGYRISSRTETVAISGDTGDCPGLRELVHGADLAILEATYQDSAQVNEDFLQRVHLSVDLAQQIGQTAKEFILVHQTTDDQL